LRKRSIPTLFTKNNTGYLTWNVKIEWKLAFNCYVSGSTCNSIEATAAVFVVLQA